MSRDRKRVETVIEAAEFLGVSRSRLQEMRREAPWWFEDLHTRDGFDVVGIARAQCEFALRRELSTASASATEQEQIASAAVTEAVETARIKTLERQKRERVELVEAKALVSADVVCGLFSEVLAELRTQLSDLAYRFGRQVPPELQSLVYESDDRPALLQRMVAEVAAGYEDYLDLIASEIFEGESDADAAKD